MAGPSRASRGFSVLLLLIVGAGAVAGIRLWMSYNDDRQAPARLPLSAAAAPSAPMASGAPQPDPPSLLRQDDKKDSPARAALFKSVLEGNGQRCDAVTT